MSLPAKRSYRSDASLPRSWGGGFLRAWRSKVRSRRIPDLQPLVSDYFLLPICQHHSLPHSWRMQFGGTGCSAARDTCELFDEAYEALAR